MAEHSEDPNKASTSRMSDASKSDLEKYKNLLIKWQKVQNLVSRETLNDIWRRHFDDSLQILECFPENASKILDIGSGGGFPAVPLAIVMRGKSAVFHLVEANRRKVSFLRAVSRELGLGLNVHGKRAEHVDPDEIGPVDVITSRATAPLSRLLGLMLPFWCEDTVAIIHKGHEFSAELSESRANWDFDVIRRVSKVDVSGVILEIRRLKSR
ncbi:MAG: 16S rRNA (guanine(527)-N(7))-methyltransferase RsmG [Devosiaceae bacterium]|nr:16S rRNA (guanine(527)-N(7))-methyltransferase RsmG [Devosiaceae bacterium]